VELSKTRLAARIGALNDFRGRTTESGTATKIEKHKIPSKVVGPNICLAVPLLKDGTALAVLVAPRLSARV